MITTKMPTMPLNIPLWCTITKIKLLTIHTHTHMHAHIHTHTHATINKQAVLYDCKMQKLQYYILFVLALVLVLVLVPAAADDCIHTYKRSPLMLLIRRITNNKQLHKQGKINKSHLLFFLTGGVGLQAVPPNPDSSWLPEKAWTQIFRASDLEG